MKNLFQILITGSVDENVTQQLFHRLQDMIGTNDSSCVANIYEKRLLFKSAGKRSLIIDEESNDNNLLGSK